MAAIVTSGPDAEREPRGDDSGGARSGGYVIGLLIATTFFYQLDRNVMYVTQELVKREFALTDTQLGLLTGTAFGLANALAGLPLGWLIDRVSRKRLLTSIVAVWSTLTILCGLAGTYTHLLLTRIGIGVAEAGGTPVCLSIVSDLYPPEQRSSRVAMVSSGYFLGTIVSFLAGGFIAATYGWRAVFVIYGVPSLMLCALVMLTMKEPPRQHSATAGTTRGPGLLDSLRDILRQPTLRLLYLAVALTSLTSAGVFTWWSSFMMRVHHLPIETVGLIGTLGIGVSGMAGMLAAGIIADRARRRRAGGPLYLLAATSLISLIAAGIAIWTPNILTMTCALFVAGATVSVYIGPGNAVISELASSHQRGVAFAVPVILTNISGVSIGPMLVGYLSDHLTVSGVEPLRLAMFAVSLLQIPVAAIYLVAGSRRDRAVG